MKMYIRKGLRVLYTYGVADLVFIVFLYPLLGLTKTRETFLAWLPWYSLLLFIFLFYVVYIDLKELAAREKKPVYNMHPYPLKGLVYGLIGAVPLAVVVAVLKFLVSFQDEIAENIKRVVVNGFLGPLLFVVKWGNDTELAYFVSILLIPVITMLGYLAGFYGINVKEKIFGKKPVPEKGFTKSPWNPTLNENKPKKKKKKKSTGKSTGKTSSADKARKEGKTVDAAKGGSEAKTVDAANARDVDKTADEDKT